MSITECSFKTELFNPDLDFNYYLDCALRDIFIIIQVPLSDYSPFFDFINDNKTFILSTEQNSRLSELLLSLFEFTYTPTAPKNIPLRIDVLVKKIQKQPDLFLGNYLKKVTEWFGLSAIRSFTIAWKQFLQNNCDDVLVPDPMKNLLKKGTIGISNGLISIPAFLIAGLKATNTTPSWDQVSSILHILRHELSTDYSPNSPFEQHLQDITNFLKNPERSLERKELEKKLARGELVDLTNYDLQGEQNQLIIDGLIFALHTLYEEDQSRYRLVFGQIQSLLWDQIIKAHREITAIENKLPTNSLLIDSTDWISSCRDVSSLLNLLSDAYVILSSFEETIGVDRYLGSKVISPDLDSIHKRIQTIRNRIQILLNDSSNIFLHKWNLSQITPLLLSMLGVPKIPTSLAPYFPHDQETIIFLLVDGLGFTQFRWLLKTIALHTISPLATNIFVWLNQNKAYNENYFLSSNLISVTGGCLPTIFTGSLPKRTGLFGTHSSIDGNALNLMKGQVIGYNAISLSYKDISKKFIDNTNQLIPSICDIASQNGVHTEVIHGGAGNFFPFMKYTYGKHANSTDKMHKVMQGDRIFSQTTQVMRELDWSSFQKSLFLLYYPSVDSSGHPSGPYTRFQSAELSKLNFLFTHFLIELVENFMFLFNGKTSIVISADHGMYESSSRVVNEQTIRLATNGLISSKAQIIYENRSCYIYGINEVDLDIVKTKLTNHFSVNNIPIKVYSKKDELVNDLIYDPKSPYSKHFPDIVLQYYGTGIFFYKENLESHQFLYGAHGGCSIDEIFVPLINIPLTHELAENLTRFYK